MATTEEWSGGRKKGAESAGKLAAETGTFAVRGEYWTLGYGATTFPLKDVKGLSYIQRLLQHPGEEFHSLDLLSGPGSIKLPDSDSGEMLDAQAKQEYQRQLRELNEVLEDQRERGNHQRAEQITSEIDFLEREIARAVGLGGRDRRAGSASERARLNVTRAIKAAMQKISEQQPSMGELLDRSIKTGTFCSYAPDSQNQVTWQFAVAGPEASGEPETTAPFLFRRGAAFVRDFADRTTFVGREAERVTLRRFVERAASGQGSVVMIGGPAGVGKTRIAAEIFAEASQRSHLTYAGSCYDREDSVPFIPFVEILEAALAQAPSLQAFRDGLGKDAAEMVRLLPQLRRLFPEIPQPMDLPPEQSRRILFNAVAELVARTAGNTPVLLLLDDLHWADEGTLSLLSYLAPLVPKIPVLIIGTYRDFELRPTRPLAKTLDDLLRLHLVEQITLGGLPQNAVAEMLRALSGRQPPEAVVRLFYSDTEGNPFFVEELFRHLVEQGKLTDSAGEFRRDLKPGDVEVPQSLRLIIGRRLARLSDPTQKTLATAAMIGRSFTFQLLEVSTRTDPDSLLDRVEEAERAGLISSTVQYPDARFDFSHELIRQTVVSGLSAARRQRLHLDVADAIERVYAQELEDHAEDLSHHLWQAGKAADTERTVRYLQMAGERAVLRSANTEAISHFRNALELIKTNAETPERLKQELKLYTATLGPAVMVTKGFASPEARSVYARAQELSQQVSEGPAAFRISWGLWVSHAARGDRGDQGKARVAGEDCLRLALEAQDPALLVVAHHALGVSKLIYGEFVQALEHFEQGAALYVPREHAPLAYFYGQDSGIACFLYRAFTLWFLGYPDQARSRLEESLAMTYKQSHLVSIASGVNIACWTYQLLRDREAAAEQADAAVSLCTEREFEFWGAMAVICQGWALTEQGLSEKGIARINTGLAAVRATGGRVMFSYFLGHLAQAYASAGLPDQGLSTLAEAQAGLDESGEHWWQAEVHRIKGELMLMRSGNQLGDAKEAEECFRRALAVSREQTAKSLELRAAMSLCRLLRKHGKQVEARQTLTEVYNWFTEGFDTPDLQEAKALIEQI